MSNTTAPIVLTDAQKRVVLREGRKNYQWSRDMLASYREDCEADRKNGHRPHYCVHGVNMWVDFDCACYQCEDGETEYEIEARTPVDYYRRALEDFRYEWPAIEAKLKGVQEHMMAVGCTNGISEEHRTAVVELYFEIAKDLQGRWA